MAEQTQRQWNWNDGGRFHCGFVGLTGDCVVRAIAIATGENYRHVYDSLGTAALKSPRQGVNLDVTRDYLESRGWQFHDTIEEPINRPWDTESPSDDELATLAQTPLPDGIVIVWLRSEHSRRAGHLCSVVNQVVQDTWDPSQEPSLRVAGYWTNAAADQQLAAGTHPGAVTATANGSGPSDDSGSGEQVLTQREFDRIMHRLRSLDNTAKNAASTEGEKRNAIRMMQNLMLRHNLSRQDLAASDTDRQLALTRLACPVNGRRAMQWEKSLAHYVTTNVFPMTFWYVQSAGHRTLFFFYGPLKDVQNCIALFRELLVTIAAAAKLQYGGFSRGSGASYCEGYVRGLPHGDQHDAIPAGDGARHGAAGKPSPAVTAEQLHANRELIQARALALKKTVLDWLDQECGVQLYTSRGAGRMERDPAAEARGSLHGSQHRIDAPGAPKRLGHR